MLNSTDYARREVSLTTPPQTDGYGNALPSEALTEEAFFRLLDAELVKIEQFTLGQVTLLRKKLSDAESQLSAVQKDSSNLEALDALKQKVWNDGVHIAKSESLLAQISTAPSSPVRTPIVVAIAF